LVTTKIMFYPWWVKVCALDIGGQWNFLAVIIPLGAGKADGLFKAGLAMGAENLDRRVISKRVPHGLFRVERLGAMAAFGAGGGNGEFLGHGSTPWDDGSKIGMDNQ
jgi:hypothetical protein